MQQQKPMIWDVLIKGFVALILSKQSRETKMSCAINEGF